MERLPRRRVVVTPEQSLVTASTTDLVRQLIQQSSELAKKEIKLARLELSADLDREIQMVRGLAVAAVCAQAALNILLASAALILAQRLTAWLSALIVAAVMTFVAAVAGVAGWGKRVKEPLAKTQKTLKDDVQWAKEQIA